MSLSSWKKEFYPVDASSVSRKDALRHSLTKWEGLRKENLKKHGVCLDMGFLHPVLRSIRNRDEEGLTISANSCALCHHFYNDDKGLNGSDCCNRCPLKKFLGLPCDAKDVSPYSEFQVTEDPEPMIRALKGTLAKLEAGKKA